MLKSEEEIKLHPPGISRLVLEHMPLIISISISFMSLNTEWSCIKETVSERNCWTGLTGLRDAGRGRVGRVGQHSGTERGFLPPLQPRWPSCGWYTVFSSVPWPLTVLREQELLGGQELVSLSFWSTAELQLHSLSYFFPLPNLDFFLMLIYY